MCLKLAERWGTPPWEVWQRYRWLALAMQAYAIEQDVEGRRRGKR